MSGILSGILEFIFFLFIEIICFYAGEIILYIISFGRKNPRWDYYTEASATKFVILTEISTWVGMAFWVFIIGVVARALAR